MTLACALATVATTPARAVGFGDPALPCASMFDAVASETLYVATINAAEGGRLGFVRGKDKGAPACPSRDAACRLRAYLVPGNVVLVSSANDAFACVHYAAAPGKPTTGLVPTAGLSFRSDGGDDSLAGPGGLGDWSAGDDAGITIKRGGDGYVMIEGSATIGPPSYNQGEIDGPAYFDGSASGTAGYTDAHYTGEKPADAAPEAASRDACRIRLRRLGPYLVVDDNDHCGGYRVTFSGVYVRK